jgi:hypothetical protein
VSRNSAHPRGDKGAGEIQHLPLLPDRQALKLVVKFLLQNWTDYRFILRWPPSAETGGHFITPRPPIAATKPSSLPHRFACYKLPFVRW